MMFLFFVVNPRLGNPDFIALSCLPFGIGYPRVNIKKDVANFMVSSERDIHMVSFHELSLV